MKDIFEKATLIDGQAVVVFGITQVHGRQERARDKVLQYAARRPAQADMWLQEAQTNYNKHSAWLDKHGSHELDMKLENLDQALDNMLLEGNFSWVCIDILYSACLSGTCEETDHVFVCKAMHV